MWLGLLSCNVGFVDCRVARVATRLGSLIATMMAGDGGGAMPERENNVREFFYFNE